MIFKKQIKPKQVNEQENEKKQIKKHGNNKI